MDETIEPITTELREFVANKIPVFYEVLHDEFDRLCDNIDAVHAQLERDYATACKVNETQDADYVALMRQRDELRDECHEEEDEDTGFICCSECGAVLPEDYTVYYCWSCGRKVVTE